MTSFSVILGGMALPAKDTKLVQIVDAALASTAALAGEWLVCRLGCTQCCYGAFAINALDAARLRAGMETLRGSAPELAAEIERRARGWIEEHGGEFPGDPVTGLLGETDADQERFEGFANEAACPALDPGTGKCDVYAWRPMTCRVFGPPVSMGEGDALGHCELCFHGASQRQVEVCEMMIPHELEAEVLEQLEESGESVVAYALIASGDGQPR